MSGVADHELDDDVNLEPQPPVVHTVSARGYLSSLKRHGRGEFWTADAVELSGIPAWRDHIKELTVPARRRRCQAFLRAVLRCFNNVAIWCDNGSGINLTPEQEKQELTIYNRDLDLCVEVFCPPSQPSFILSFPTDAVSFADWFQRLGFHFDTFVRDCRDVFDRLFSERMRAGLPKVVGSAVEVANLWPSRKRGDRLLTVSSYRSACRKE